MDLLVAVYLAYSVVAISLIVFLAKTLFSAGTAFLDDVFDDNPLLARAVNRLLVIGFYMANLGYAAMLLRSNRAADAVQAVEVLANKLGILLLSLAGLHFANLFVFFRLRRRATAAILPPPVAPQAKVRRGVDEFIVAQ